MVKRMKFDTIDISLLKRTMVTVIEYIINNFFIPGQIENWNIIVDLKGLGLGDIPVSVAATDSENARGNRLSPVLLPFACLQDLRDEHAMAGQQHLVAAREVSA